MPFVSTRCAVQYCRASARMYGSAPGYRCYTNTGQHTIAGLWLVLLTCAQFSDLWFRHSTFEGTAYALHFIWLDNALVSGTDRCLYRASRADSPFSPFPPSRRVRVPGALPTPPSYFAPRILCALPHQTKRGTALFCGTQNTHTHSHGRTSFTPLYHHFRFRRTICRCCAAFRASTPPYCTRHAHWLHSAVWARGILGMDATLQPLRHGKLWTATRSDVARVSARVLPPYLSVILLVVFGCRTSLALRFLRLSPIISYFVCGGHSLRCHWPFNITGRRIIAAFFLLPRLCSASAASATLLVRYLRLHHDCIQAFCTYLSYALQAP